MHNKQKKDNAVEFANQMINLDKRFYSLIKILERNRNKNTDTERRRENPEMGNATTTSRREEHE